MKTLFFDIIVTGHHSEYISHLVNYLYDNNNSNSYYFVVHPEFSQKFPAIANKAKSTKNIHWQEISDEEVKSIRGNNLILKSVAFYKIMNKYALEFKIDHVCLLFFNHFQFILGLVQPPYKISGILFLPFLRQSRNSFTERVKYYKKYLQTRFYARNKSIDHIFLLNDNDASETLNKMVKRERLFRTLYDPIPDLVSQTHYSAKEEYNIDNNRKIFLHIGSLSIRKGTLDVLDSALSIPLEKQVKTCILLVGKADSKLEPILVKRIDRIRSKTLIQVVWDNNFVSNEKMKSLLEQCDCVLIPYKNPESSSGILGNAHASGKPVIGPSEGLLGNLIKSYNLGYITDTFHPLGNQIIKFIDKGFSFTRNNDFLKDKNPSFFAKALIE